MGSNSILFQIFYSVWLQSVSQPCGKGTYKAVWTQKNHISGNTVVWLLNCCFSTHDFVFHSIIFRSPFFFSSYIEKGRCHHLKHQAEKYMFWWEINMLADWNRRPSTAMLLLQTHTGIFFFLLCCLISLGDNVGSARLALDWSKTVITPGPFSAQISLNQTKPKIH